MSYANKLITVSNLPIYNERLIACLRQASCKLYFISTEKNANTKFQLLADYIKANCACLGPALFHAAQYHDSSYPDDEAQVTDIFKACGVVLDTPKTKNSATASYYKGSVAKVLQQAKAALASKK